MKKLKVVSAESGAVLKAARVHWRDPEPPEFKDKVFATSRDSLNPATAQYALQTVYLIKLLFNSREHTTEQLEQVIADGERARIFERYPEGKPYGSMEALLKAEINCGSGPEAAVEHQSNRNGHYTTREYTAFDQAFDYFNGKLFDGQLPPCLITLQRRGRTRGYFSAGRFEERGGETLTDEIALNPDTFKGRTDNDILSTLVHEMTHHWQGKFGSPGRGRYHNREWADEMERLGLAPSDTGQPGGRRTGQSVSHHIVPDGPFDVAARALVGTGFRLTWQSPQTPGGRKKIESKTKYACLQCGQNAWAKPSASLYCGQCYAEMLAPGSASGEPRRLTLLPDDPFDAVGMIYEKFWAAGVEEIVAGLTELLEAELGEDELAE